MSVTPMVSEGCTVMLQETEIASALKGLETNKFEKENEKYFLLLIMQRDTTVP